MQRFIRSSQGWENKGNCKSAPVSQMRQVPAMRQANSFTIFNKQDSFFRSATSTPGATTGYSSAFTFKNSAKGPKTNSRAWFFFGKNFEDKGNNNERNASPSANVALAWDVEKLNGQQQKVNTIWSRHADTASLKKQNAEEKAAIALSRGSSHEQRAPPDKHMCDIQSKGLFVSGKSMQLNSREQAKGSKIIANMLKLRKVAKETLARKDVRRVSPAMESNKLDLIDNRRAKDQCLKVARNEVISANKSEQICVRRGTQITIQLPTPDDTEKTAPDFSTGNTDSKKESNKDAESQNASQDDGVAKEDAPSWSSCGGSGNREQPENSSFHNDGEEKYKVERRTYFVNQHSPYLTRPSQRMFTVVFPDEVDKIEAPAKTHCNPLSPGWISPVPYSKLDLSLAYWTPEQSPLASPSHHVSHLHKKQHFFRASNT